LDDRLLGVAGQLVENLVDLIAHFLRRDVAVLFENELDGDDRVAFAGDAAQFVYAGDGVDGFFDALGDLGFDFLRLGAR